jgi:hypothetical protein
MDMKFNSSLDISRAYLNFKDSSKHGDMLSSRVSSKDTMSRRFSEYRFTDGNKFFRFYPSFNLGSGIFDNNEFVGDNTLGFYSDASFEISDHFIGVHAGVIGFAGVSPYYLRLLQQERRIIPGLWASNTLNESWNVAWMPDVYVHYETPWHIYVETGIGKQHIGNGYRSLMLSENAPAYPYARLGANFSNINYQMQWMFLKNHEFQPWVDSEARKFAMMHYLSWNVSKRISLGIFESIVWSDAGGRKAFETQYLNPIVFFRPVEFSLGSSDNALMGLNLSYKITSNFQFYGQFVLDDLQVGELMNDIKYRLNILDDGVLHGWFANKYGGQIGFKYFNVFGIKNLYFQTEVNAVRPCMYAHNNVNQSYTSDYQALAHPLGSNFIESVTRIHYRYKSWQIGLDILIAEKGLSGINSNAGEDIFYPVSDGPGQAWIEIPTYGNVILQGERMSISHVRLDISWMPLGNESLEIFTTSFFRKSAEDSGVTIKDSGVMIGARTQVSALKSFF